MASVSCDVAKCTADKDGKTKDLLNSIGKTALHKMYSYHKILH